MKRLLYLLLFLASPLLAAQPPYPSSNPSDEENMNVIYGEMATHHLRSRDVIPDQDSTRDLGRSGTEWANLYVDSITVTNPGSFLGYKVGTFTSKATAGNQSVTGIGFKPRLVIFHMMYTEGGNSQNIALGSMDSSGNMNTSGMFHYDTDPTGNIQATSGAACLAVGDDKAEYVSMNSDGFTLAWTYTRGSMNSKGVGYIAFQ